MTNESIPVHCCPEYADRLVDLSDGELTADNRIAVEAHVTGCAACREQLARLNKSLAAFKSAIREPAPVDRRANRCTPRAALWIAAGGTAAAILLAVGIASFLKAPTIGRGDSPSDVVQVPSQNNTSPPGTPTIGRGLAALTTDDALRRIALLEQQARLETSLALLPDDPWFADRRAANEQLLSTYRAAAAASDSAPKNNPNAKETL